MNNPHANQARSSHLTKRTQASPAGPGGDGLEREPALFDELEPRLCMAFASSIVPDLPSLGLTSTASDALIHLADAQPITMAGASSSGGTNGQLLLGLDRFRADSRFAGINGRGSSVVIIDTGINASHPFFGPDANRDGVSDRIVYRYNFATNSATAGDADGHGSNVASIVGSSDSTYAGVAPGVNIIALGVSDASGSMSVRNIERALQWVVANVNQFNIVGVNMSLGDPNSNFSSSISMPGWGLGDELAALAARNVITVAAAGNSYFSFQREGVSYPAADPNVLAVGAVYAGDIGGVSYGSGARATTTGADRLTPFSQRSTTIQTIFAPGAPITGAAGTGSGLVTMHGTSQASPQVAGTVALAQQLAQQYLGRRLTLNEFRNLLTTSSTRITDGDDERDNVAHTNKQYLRLNIPALANAILAMSSNAPANPPANPSNPAPPTPAPPPTPPAPPAPPSQPNRAPTMVNPGVLVGMPMNSQRELTYSFLRSALGAADADGDAISLRVLDVVSGRLTKAGHNLPVSGAGRGIIAGESLTWAAPTNRQGVSVMFTGLAVDSRGGQSRPFAIAAHLVANGARPASEGGDGLVLSLINLDAPSAPKQPAFIQHAEAARPGNNEFAFDLRGLMGGHESSGLLNRRAA